MESNIANNKENIAKINEQVDELENTKATKEELILEKNRIYVLSNTKADINMLLHYKRYLITQVQL